MGKYVLAIGVPMLSGFECFARAGEHLIGLEEIRAALNPRPFCYEGRTLRPKRWHTPIGETERCYLLFRRLHDPQAGDTRPGDCRTTVPFAGAAGRLARRP